MGFDRPFNQIPSLHIALAVIPWALYARKLRGLARILLDVWFMLIGASVLTTYQHHFIDIPTGLALGWLCAWLWPFADGGVQEPASAWRWTTDPARHRLAGFHGLGALGYSRSACAVAAWLLATGRAATVETALAQVRSARAQVALGAPRVAVLRAVRLHDSP